MRFGWMLQTWVSSRSSLILVNFSTGVSPQGDNTLSHREPGVTNWPVTTLCLVSHRWLCNLTIGMWGYTPVGITGVLVSLISAVSLF